MLWYTENTMCCFIVDVLVQNGDLTYNPTYCTVCSWLMMCSLALEVTTVGSKLVN